LQRVLILILPDRVVDHVSPSIQRAHGNHARGVRATRTINAVEKIFLAPKKETPRELRGVVPLSLLRRGVKTMIVTSPTAP
jgi:hypothetical protein